MNPLSIQVKDLHKVFESHGKRVEVLKGIDLDIKKGEMLSIVGASGAGKSTLLHIIGAIETPSAGSVFYEDEDLFSMNDKRLAQFRNNKIGFIFQFHHLLPEFSAIENTMMPALIRGIKKREAYKDAANILNKVGLEQRISHKPGELSGGEQQRVAIARALMLKPEVILADEPTGNLDTNTGNSIQELLIDLNTELKMTLVMVTHNRILADKMPRKISLMDGRIVSDVVL